MAATAAIIMMTTTAAAIMYVVFSELGAGVEVAVGNDEGEVVGEGEAEGGIDGVGVSCVVDAPNA